MKSLREYLMESSKSVDSKEIVFDFKDLEGADETLKGLKDLDGVTIDDKKLTVTVDANTVGKLDSVQEILNDYCHTIRNSQKRASDENYAQKTVSFEKSLNELMDAIDEIENPDVEDPEEDDEDKDDEDKK